MHISEGVLFAPTLAAGAAAGVTFLGIGLKKMEGDQIPRVAVLSAAFFVASLVHVPVGPANIHLVLTGLVGLLLGWSAFPAIVVALALQAVLFGYGGLTTLGINTCVMGIPAVVVHALFYRLSGNASRKLAMTAGFAAGALAVGLASGLLLIVLTSTGEPFRAIAKVVFVTNLPLVFVEGLITMFLVGFIHKVRPELLALDRL